PVSYEWQVKTGQITNFVVSVGGSPATVLRADSVSTGFGGGTADLSYTLYHKQAAISFDVTERKADGSVLRRIPDAILRNDASQGVGNTLDTHGTYYFHNDAASVDLVARMETADGQ